MLNQWPIGPTIPVSDMNRAKVFYKDKLGFEPIKEYPQGVSYKSGESEFMLFPSPNAGKAVTTYAGWEVTGIEGIVKDLQSKGVKFEEYDTPEYKTVNGIADFGPAKVAWFKDSEGNTLAISQMS